MRTKYSFKDLPFCGECGTRLTVKALNKFDRKSGQPIPVFYASCPRYSWFGSLFHDDRIYIEPLIEE